MIGFLASSKSKENHKDYLLAGQAVKPWLVALSALATATSGYMFIGAMGYIYLVGLSAIWITPGWAFGELFSSLLIYKKLRRSAQATNSLSFSSALANWSGKEYKILRIIGGLFTIFFLAGYIAAQFNAGAKALHVLFGWEYGVGAAVGALIILFYSFRGGMRASIWTDAAQFIIMFLSMGLIVFISIYSFGGIGNFINELDKVSPNYMSWFPEDTHGFGQWTALFSFIIGWVIAGVGTAGQPHIMTRYMSIKAPAKITRVRVYFYTFNTIFSLMTLCAGLATRVLIPESALFDAELALPHISMKLLPEVLVGFILAGLFSASLSTADSQILSCTGSIAEEIRFRQKKLAYKYIKYVSLFVILLSLVIALFAYQSVFTLVLLSWSVLASVFTPLLIVYAFGGRPTQTAAISMMMAGFVTVLIWRYAGMSLYLYDVGPGIVAGLLVFGAFHIKKRFVDQR